MTPPTTLALTLTAATALALSAETPLAMNDQPTNRLITEQSPYLIQHAHNPVDWYPWGDEAFAKAQAENKPVLLSIGYSTCHWCHVMNRESFSDPETAAYLNEHYICIKVDREERPDIDSVHMNFVQQLTGSGGWPLNVWLTPDRKPFYGGTYFPPAGKPGMGRTTFPDILKRISELWANDSASVIARSQGMVDTLNDSAKLDAEGSTLADPDLYSKAIESFANSYDAENGGFGGAPKFPSPANLSFLLRLATLPELAADQRQQAWDMASGTLDAIARGGMRDQLGGGFHRYSVDPGWRIPHYEKMLYDQALLAAAYAEAWTLSPKPQYRDALETTLDYLLREMRHPEGGFYSAEDADSYDPENPGHKREGAFFVWRQAEIEQVLGPDLAPLAIAYFGVQPDGNAPTGPYHTEELEGFNTLLLAKPLDSVAADQIQTARKLLFEARSKRQRPHLDDKVIGAWNGMAISAFAKAGAALNRPDYLAAAAQAADFILAKLNDPQTHRLARLYRETPSAVAGFAEDYAYLVQALIDLYEADGQIRWLQQSAAWQETMDTLFYDPAEGGYFDFQKSREIVFEPSKESFDGAVPAASSIAASNLARLAILLGSEDLAAKSDATLKAFIPLARQQPQRLPVLLGAAVYTLKKPAQIIIAGPRNDPATQALLDQVNQAALPARVIIHADDDAGQAWLSQRIEVLDTIGMIANQPTAYVCENFVCQRPTTDPKELAQQLSKLKAPLPRKP